MVRREFDPVALTLLVEDSLLGSDALFGSRALKVGPQT